MNQIADFDTLCHISLLEGQARALFATSTHLCERARQTHGLSRTATAALGRLLTVSAMMGATLKGASDSLTVTVKGGGPLGTLLAVAKSDGSVKGSVDDPAADPPRKPNGKLDVGGAVGREGSLTVVKDMGMREPYVGQVALASGEIGEDMAYYFTASEQTPSVVSVGVLTGEHVLAAGGLIVQPMPGCSEAALQSLEMSAPMFTNISDTLMRLRLDGAIEDLFSHLQYVVLEKKALRYECDCSRARVERALISLGEAELSEMIREDNGASVSCQFCHTDYRFTGGDLAALLRAAKSRAEAEDSSGRD